MSRPNSLIRLILWLEILLCHVITKRRISFACWYTTTNLMRVGIAHFLIFSSCRYWFTNNFMPVPATFSVMKRDPVILSANLLPFNVYDCFVWYSPFCRILQKCAVKLKVQCSINYYSNDYRLGSASLWVFKSFFPWPIYCIYLSEFLKSKIVILIASAFVFDNLS